jgi:DHA3 family tetracycline resistance protein-like MFS transporter
VNLLRPLRERDFALLWTGMTVSLLGDGIYTVAVAWQVYQLSNRPSALALVGLSWTAGLVLFILLAGVLSDRLDRRRVMIGADLLRAAVQLGIGALALTHSLELWMLIPLVLVHGIGEAFFAPAFSALVPDILAPALIPQASAIEQIVRQAARNFAGPAIGGVLVALLGPGTSFVVDAGTFVFSAACVFAIRTRPAIVRERAAGMVAELRVGIAYVRTQTWLWGTLVAASTAILFFMGPIQVLVPYVVKNRLHSGSGSYGTILALEGLGAIAMSLWVAARGLPRREVSWMLLMWSFGGIPFLGFALGQAVWVLAVCACAWGASLAFGMIVWTTRMATRVPVELRGRVNSVDWFVSIGLAPASYALTGPVSSWIGVRDTLLIAAIVPAVSTFALLFLTGMRAEETRELQAAAVGAGAGSEDTGGSGSIPTTSYTSS